MSDNANTFSGQERYFLKRLRDDVSIETVKLFLEKLKSVDIQNEPTIGFSFQSLLRDIDSSSLKLTKKTRAEIIVDPNQRPNDFLYKSDLAYIFSDILNIFLKDLSSWFDPNKDNLNTPLDTDVLQALYGINIYCQRHANGQYEITGNEDRELSDLLTNKIIGFTKLTAALIELKEKKDNNEDEQPVEENNEDEDSQTITEDPATSATTRQNNDSTKNPEPPTDAKDENTNLPDNNDPLSTKSNLFSKDLRDQASKFTGIALAQLEIQNGLPTGSLANSPELLKVLNDKTLGFFLTTLGNGRAKDLIDPETRLTLIREYIWLVQNDFRTTSLISNRLKDLNDLNPSGDNPLEVELPDGSTVTLKSKNELEQQVNSAINKAADGTGPNAESFVAGIASNKIELDSIFEQLGNDQLVTSDDNYLTRETKKLLETELKRIGVQTDRLPLVEKNVFNILDAWTFQGLPIEILQYIDEKKFRLIFGEDIPFNEDFFDSLEEVWIARRSILGRNTGQILLHNEARFATQEALDLLNKDKNILSEQEIDDVFESAVAAPTRQLLVSSKGPVTRDVQEIVELTYSKTPLANSAKQEVFLKQVWLTKDASAKQEILVALGYGDPGSKAIQNLAENADFYPKEIGLHDMAPLLGGGAAFYNQSQNNNIGSSYIPNSGILQNPLANVKQYGQRTKGLANNLKNGVKGIRSKLSKKAASQAANKVAQAGLTTAASTATGAINPALGFLTKLASTKKGHRALMIGGALGAGSLLIPLTTLGGQIGSVIGGILGGIFGGPAGAFGGAIAGGWTGYGAQRWLENLFSSNSSSNIFNPLTNQVTASSPLAQSALGAQTTAATATQATTLNTASTTFVGQTITHVAGQAILGTVGLITASELMFQSTAIVALSADFPVVEPLGAFSIGGVDGKVSEFVSIEKRAFIAGCPENKCESPSFPIKVEYTVTISPKGNYTIQILDATDTLKVNHSKKAWEEKGKTPPTVPDRIKNLTDFPELYEEIIIEPGGSITLVYSDILDEKYNDASVTNKFELKVFAKDPATGKEGTDTAVTGEVVYIGDYSQGEGCWPTSGLMWQLPFNQGEGSTHKRWDAFDIINVEGTPIYTPFAGKACPGTRAAETYGIHVTLQSDKGTFQFSHLHSTNGISNACKDVQPGDVIGYMGTTGMGGVHLDWAKIGRGSAPSDLAPMMPDGLNVKKGDTVRSCYDGG